MEILILAILLALMLWALILAYRYTRKKWLTESRKKFYLEKIEHASTLWEREAIIQCDKLLAHILKEYGYEWTVADQLKRNPKPISDIQEVWRLHKLRNKLVHELDSPGWNLTKEVRKYQSILRELVR